MALHGGTLADGVFRMLHEATQTAKTNTMESSAGVDVHIEVRSPAEHEPSFGDDGRGMEDSADAVCGLLLLRLGPRVAGEGKDDNEARISYPWLTACYAYRVETGPY